MITQAERSRIRHAKGLCGRCSKPARQRPDGRFYWHCPPCQRFHSKRQSAWKNKNKAPEYKRTPRLIARAILAQSMLTERRVIGEDEQLEAGQLIAELRDRILYLERRVKKLKTKKAATCRSQRSITETGVAYHDP